MLVIWRSTLLLQDTVSHSTEIRNVKFSYQEEEWRITLNDIIYNTACWGWPHLQRPPVRGVPRFSPTWIPGGSALLKGSSRSLVGKVLASWEKKIWKINPICKMPGNLLCVLGFLWSVFHLLMTFVQESAGVSTQQQHLCIVTPLLSHV